MQHTFYCHGGEYIHDLYPACITEKGEVIPELLATTTKPESLVGSYEAEYGVGEIKVAFLGGKK
jgi:hypothetical protein